MSTYYNTSKRSAVHSTYEKNKMINPVSAMFYKIELLALVLVITIIISIVK